MGGRDIGHRLLLGLACLFLLAGCGAAPRATSATASSVATSSPTTLPTPQPGTPPPRGGLNLPVATCPPGSNPDEPGPADQARPVAYGWSPKAFDRRAGKLIVLVGGEGAPGAVVETWTFDVCTNTWTRMHPNREPPLQVMRLVYDFDAELTIGVNSKDWEPGFIGNVWAYDLEANTWTEHGMAVTSGLRFYDPVSASVFADGWTYNIEARLWTQIAFGADCYLCVYDGSVDRAIKYAFPERGVRETWLLNLRAGTWSRSGAETPDYIIGWMPPAIVYDEAAERTVVAGGRQWGAYDASTDRWEILFERDPSEARTLPQAYDPVNRRLLVFDGSTGDILAFDLETREWTMLLASAGR